MAAVMVTATAARDPADAAPAASRRRGAPPPAVFRRRRLVAAGVLLAVIVLAVLVVGRVATVLGGAPAVPGHRPGPASYVVQPGDTLWSIARSLQPEGDVPAARATACCDANGGARALGRAGPDGAVAGQGPAIRAAGTPVRRYRSSRALPCLPSR